MQNQKIMIDCVKLENIRTIIASIPHQTSHQVGETESEVHFSTSVIHTAKVMAPKPELLLIYKVPLVYF